MTRCPTASPELLAPAGDFDCLRAAVCNGADAVYLGLSEFNARARAANFPIERLGETVEYLHDRNVRAYVALNTLVFSGELDRLAGCVEAAARAGADAVIVQDLGVAALARAMVPALPVHASTQMSLADAPGAAAAADLGIRRVILARELSLADIRAVRSATDVELEVFVHGALCIACSGQCLASASLFGRSGNRGQCAQPCRLPYEWLVDGRRRGRADRRYLLSPCDLFAADRIADLLSAGVAGFKIEGRLKGPHYVAATVRLYRRALDAALAGRAFAPSPRDRRVLEQVFSRRGGRGFLDGADPRALVHGRYPDSRGVRVGTVVGRSARGLLVAPADDESPPVAAGDGVVFVGGDQQAGQGGRVYGARSLPEGRGAMELTFGRRDVDPAAVPARAEVWKTDDPPLRAELEATYARDVGARPVRVDMVVGAVPGLPLRLTVADRAGAAPLEVTAGGPLEAARKQPLTRAVLREQLGRLGGTPFVLGELALLGPQGQADMVEVMAPRSVLNALRRAAVEALRQRRREAAVRPMAEPRALARLRAQAAGERAAGDGAPCLHVLVRDAGALEALAGWPCPAGVVRGLAYLDFWPLPAPERLAALRVAGWTPAGVTPRVVTPGDEWMVAALAEASFPAVLVRNLSAARTLAGRGAVLIGDASLQGANELSARVLRDLGLSRITPAYEVRGEELAAMLGRTDPSAVEVVLRQHVPLFHMAHCLWAWAEGVPNCQACSRPCRTSAGALRDRLGHVHPVRADAVGRCTVFGARCERRKDAAALRSAGVRHFRVELLDEAPAVARRRLDEAAAALGAGRPGR